MRCFLMLGFVGLLGALTTATGFGDDKDEALPAFPKVGSVIPGPFHVLNLNGERKGRFHCLVCRNSFRPTAAILARLRDGDDDGAKQLDPDQPLAKLIVALDGISAKYADAYLGTFAVFLSDQEDDQVAINDKLETLTRAAKLKQIVFAFDHKAEAKGYFVDAKDAGADFKGLAWGAPGVKVILYSNYRVVEHHDFTKDKPLTDKDAAAIAATFLKMVPESFTKRKKTGANSR